MDIFAVGHSSALIWDCCHMVVENDSGQFGWERSVVGEFVDVIGVGSIVDFVDFVRKLQVCRLISVKG